MSLILDALRKSEAERRKAQVVADPLAEVARAPAASFAVSPAWVLATVAVAALALAAWWWMARSAPPEGMAVGTTGTGGTTALHTGTGHVSRDLVRQDAAQAATDRDAATRTDAGLPDSMVPPPAASAPASTRGAAIVAPPSIEAAGTAARGTAQADAAQPTAHSAAVPMPTSASSAAMPSPSAPATATPAPTLPASGVTEPSAVPREPVASAPRADTGALLRLADLSTADRQQLPPLKMSMHMWGAETARRFAIIDGNRVGEGDRLGDAVVETIDQDGVVLAWNGIRVRVPVR